MDQQAMRDRTKDFALRIIRVVATLPENRIGDVLGRQLLKSGTSVGANYREALRASSKKHFTSIMEISLREADETDYWLELISESNQIDASRLADLKDECNQLIAILAATVKSSKEP